MKSVTIFTLFESIKELFKSIYTWAIEDAERMEELKRKHELAQMDLDGEWTDSRGKEGLSWKAEDYEDEKILGI